MGLEDRLEGVLTIDDDTGTEGVVWAFMNSKFITENKTLYVCKKCYCLWNKEKEPDCPNFKPLRKENIMILLNEELANLPVCPPNEHEFELNPKNLHSYEGLDTLGNGDHLTIYDPNDRDKVVWSGEINLRIYDPFTEAVFGHYIVADQIGIERETWAEYFFNEYPARLVKK